MHKTIDQRVLGRRSGIYSEGIKAELKVKQQKTGRICFWSIAPENEHLEYWM